MQLEMTWIFQLELQRVKISMTSLLRTAYVLSWKSPAVPSHYRFAYEIRQELCLRWFCYDLMYHNSVFFEALYLLSSEQWHGFYDRSLYVAFKAKKMEFTVPS